MGIGDYRNSIRVARGFSYETLSARSGVSRGYIFALLHENTNVGIYTLAKIATAFDMTLTDVISTWENSGATEAADIQPLPFE